MSTEFEEEYLDVLQNIEWALFSLTEDHQDLCDHDMLRIIQEVLAYYNSIHKRISPMMQNKFSGIHNEVFERVITICNWRIKPEFYKKKFLTPITIEELLLCLKQIEKSIKFWTKQNGRKGYINFARPYALVSEKQNNL